MLSALTQSLGRLSIRTASQTSSNVGASTSSNFSLFRVGNSSSSIPFNWPQQQLRFKSQLAPRRTKYRKAHKGRVPLAIGGSLKGTTLNDGMYGIRLLEPARLSAKQLQSAETALKRKLKAIKGARPTVSGEDLKRNEEWTKEFGSEGA